MYDNSKIIDSALLTRVLVKNAVRDVVTFDELEFRLLTTIKIVRRGVLAKAVR